MRHEYSGEKRDLFELDVYELDAVEPNMIEYEEPEPDVVEIDLTAAEAHEPDVYGPDVYDDDFDEDDLVTNELDEAGPDSVGPASVGVDSLELVADGDRDGDGTGADEPAGDERELARSQRNHPAARRPSWERRTRAAVTSLAVVAIMFLFVFPTRSYLAQRRQVSQARHAVAVLKAQNASLARETKQLHTPTEIERLARVEFNMVFKGEQAYSVIPAPAASSQQAGGSSSKSTTTAP